MDRFPTVVVIDIETTGLEPDKDQIIEVGAVKFSRGKQTETYQSLVYLDGHLSDFIQQLTGINPQQLQDAPSWKEVKQHFEEFCQDAVIAGHNISFDLQFLQKAGVKLPTSLMDTLELARVFLPWAPSHSLDYLRANFLHDSSTGHRALEDSRASARLLEQFLKQIYALDVNVLRKVVLVAPQQWLGRYAFETALKHLAWEQSTHQESAATKENDKPPADDTVDFCWDNINQIFTGANGITTVLDHYEERPQQVSMAERIHHAFAAQCLTVVEAETGTGKTLAYLVPAGLWALGNGERVVVSTNTLSLQQQLWAKDIPLLQKLLPEGFRAAIIKGRTNYLCRRKWSYWLTQTETLPDWKRTFFIAVLLWENSTTTGDRSELNLKQKMLETWYRLSAEGETCWGSSCTWFRSCYVTRAKRAANGANILVANHSLVLADALSEHQVLPEFDRLIIDEAHHFEETASRQLGKTVSVPQLLALLQELRTLKPPGEFAAVFPGDNLIKVALSAKEAAEDVNQLSWLTKEMLDSHASAHLRITTQVAQGQLWPRWTEQASIITDKFKYLHHLVINLSDDILDADIQADGWTREVQGLAVKVQACYTAIEEIATVDNEDFVSWLEKGINDSLSFNRRPVNVAPLLQDFYAKFGSLVLTSATLTISNRFKFLENNLGLANWQPVYHRVASPFDHASQAMMCVPNDLPPASSPVFLDKALPLLGEIIATMGGATLVLFTSYQMLRDCYYPLKKQLAGTGVNLLAQGIDGDRWQLVEQLKNDASTVVFGAQSFWEGVDVPGANLCCVVIMRLPFLPPTDPVMAARLEKLERQQKNAFYYLSLPLAILRFKQGVGRLIRSSQDKGAVVVLDTRIINKRYGQYFIESLPGMSVKMTSSVEVMDIINNFLVKD